MKYQSSVLSVVVVVIGAFVVDAGAQSNVGTQDKEQVSSRLLTYREREDFERLEKALTSKTGGFISKWAVVDEIQKYGTYAVPALIDALADETNSRLRVRAADALGKIGDPKALHALILAMDDSQYTVRESAARALGQTKDARAVDALVKAFQNGDWGMRKASAKALGNIGDVKAVEGLLQAIADPSKKDVDRYIARMAIVKIGDPAVDTLITALNNKSLQVRLYVIDALGEIKDRRALEPLMKAFESKELRGRAAMALRYFKEPRVIKLLIGALHDQDAYIRSVSAEALGEIGDKQAVDPIIELLNDKINRGKSQVSAAVALGNLGGKKATPALLKSLRSENVYVREASARALGKIGDPTAVDLLIETTDDEGQRVRAAAIEALGKLGSKRAVRTIIGGLNDQDHFAIRKNAAEALGNLGDHLAVEPLIESLKDKDYMVKQNAADALGKLKDISSIDPLIKVMSDGAVRKHAAFALVEIGSPALDSLAKALQTNPDEEVRRMMVLILSDIGDKRAVPALKKALGDEHYSVREVAEQVIDLTPLLAVNGNLSRTERIRLEKQRVTIAKQAVKLAEMEGVRPVAIIAHKRLLMEAHIGIIGLIDSYSYELRIKHREEIKGTLMESWKVNQESRATRELCWALRKSGEEGVFGKSLEPYNLANEMYFMTYHYGDNMAAIRWLQEIGEYEDRRWKDPEKLSLAMSAYVRRCKKLEKDMQNRFLLGMARSYDPLLARSIRLLAEHRELLIKTNGVFNENDSIAMLQEREGVLRKAVKSMVDVWQNTGFDSGPLRWQDLVITRSNCCLAHAARLRLESSDDKNAIKQFLEDLDLWSNLWKRQQKLTGLELCIIKYDRLVAEIAGGHDYEPHERLLGGRLARPLF